MRFVGFIGFATNMYINPFSNNSWDLSEYCDTAMVTVSELVPAQEYWVIYSLAKLGRLEFIYHERKRGLKT